MYALEAVLMAHGIFTCFLVSLITHESVELWVFPSLWGISHGHSGTKGAEALSRIQMAVSMIESTSRSQLQRDSSFYCSEVGCIRALRVMGRKAWLAITQHLIIIRAKSEWCSTWSSSRVIVQIRSGMCAQRHSPNKVLQWKWSPSEKGSPPALSSENYLDMVDYNLSIRVRPPWGWYGTV